MNPHINYTTIAYKNKSGRRKKAQASRADGRTIPFPVMPPPLYERTFFMDAETKRYIDEQIARLRAELLKKIQKKG